MTTATQEAFLRSFHAQHTGVTSRLLAQGRAADGRSSYELLRDKVKGNDRVLDLGCGDGYLLELLAADGHSDLIGLDLSSEELAAAGRRPALVGTRLIFGRAQSTPFGDGVVDACVCHMAFMLMNDIELVAAEVARVLAPGGKLALVLGGGNSGGAYDLFKRLFTPMMDSLPAADHIPALGDRRVRTQAGLDEVLTPAGFAAVDWESVGIDLTGSVDRVWEVAAGFYNYLALDGESAARLRADFFEQAPAIALPDGRLPWSVTVNLATTHRV